MTNTSKYDAKYSSDVEQMKINDGNNSWERQRTSTELKSFITRHIGLVGEIDPSEYDFDGSIA